VLWITRDYGFCERPNFSLVGGYEDFDCTLKLAEINAVQFLTQIRVKRVHIVLPTRRLRETTLILGLAMPGIQAKETSVIG